MVYYWNGTNGELFPDEFDYNGSDRLYARAWGGDDFVWGASQNDTIFGGWGDDTLRGWYGNDALYGEGDYDVLVGEWGNDYLNGGDGDDRLVGSYSTSYNSYQYDTLVGGGTDYFYLGETYGNFYQGAGYATITDFNYVYDYIRVKGSTSTIGLIYRNEIGGSALDTIIYQRSNGDWLGVVQDNTNVSLSTRDFIFV